jgi:hypothetical protein
MTLTRDAILAANDTKLVEVDIPEWGGKVHVRPMTGAERDSYDMEMVATGKPENLRGRMAVRTICDETGKRLFTDADAEMVGSKCASALDRIYAIASKQSRIGDAEVADLKKD